MNRRTLLALATGLPLVRLHAAARMAQSATSTTPVGLQMFSLRAEEQQDRLATLTAVAAMGYTGVEFYAPYAEWTLSYARTVRAHLDSLGLRCFSTHTSRRHFAPEHLPRIAELNQILGSRYVVMAYSEETTGGRDAWAKLAGELTAAHETLKGLGLRASFHNWPIEFETRDGLRGIDLLMAGTPADFGFQIDTGGVFTHRVDLVAFLEKYPGRVRSYHLKDWAADRNRLILGEGTVGWRSIFAAAERVGGVEYYLIEQEGSRLTPMETARLSIERYRQLRA